MIATVEINIMSNILAKIKANKYLALIPDEAVNILHKENLYLVIRFVDMAKTTVKDL